jgi:hypothetical protein
VGSDSHGVIRYSEHINGSGDEFFKHACEYGIEGIVKEGIGAEGGNRKAVCFTAFCGYLPKTPAKVALSVCAYRAFRAFRAFSCDLDVTPTFNRLPTTISGL